MKTSFRIYLKVTLFVLLAVAVVLGAVGAWLYHDHKSKSWATVHYLTPDGESIERVRLGEEHTLLVPEEIEGYTFLRWRDEQGNTEKRDSITVREDVWYAADYAIALETKEHPVYLFPDENGYYRPQDPMLRSDAVTMLHILLGKPSGSGSFLDVAKKAPYAKAAAALRELGVISGSRLHPDEAITRGELLEMLATLYPAAKEGYVFADLEPGQPFYDACCTAAEQGWIESGKKVKANADEILTRAETAGIINRITGRAERPGARILQVGCPVDLYPSEEGYWDMIEACIPHEFSMILGKEIWTDSKPLPVHEPGFFFSGVRLHCIAEDGNPVVNTSLDGLLFNSNGEITSGDAELDQKLWEILEKTIDPDIMTREEMLRAVYDHVVANYNYIYGRMYAFGVAISRTGRWIPV